MLGVVPVGRFVELYGPRHLLAERVLGLRRVRVARVEMSHAIVHSAADHLAPPIVVPDRRADQLLGFLLRDNAGHNRRAGAAAGGLSVGPGLPSGTRCAWQAPDIAGRTHPGRQRGKGDTADFSSVRTGRTAVVGALAPRSGARGG